MDIVIVGGGFSGTLVAANLLREARAGTRVRMVERGQECGEGLAYSTKDRAHLLNVRAKGMSAFPHDPDHFLRFLEAHCPEELPHGPHTFVPRAVYGGYVKAVLAGAVAQRARGVRFESVCAEAENVTRGEGAWQVHLAGGARLTTDAVVLALGNFPPRDPPVLNEAFYASARYKGDPWAPGALLGLDADAPVVLLGSGLTMVDVAVSLAGRGHTGRLTAVSRRGLLPRAHTEAPQAPYPAFLNVGNAPRTTGALLARVRAEVRAAASRGLDWRAVLDALREDTPALWRRLPPEEQRRFLRFLQPYWDTHRHRMAPEVAAKVRGLRDSGQLRILAGRVLEFAEGAHEVQVKVRVREGGLREFAAARVINCTGPNGQLCAERHPLVQGVLSSGLGRPDPLGMGFDVTEAGALVGASGAVSAGLFTLGSLCRGTRLETTAVPEISLQAAALARELLTGPPTTRGPI